jgi:16S rRNA (adenine1518-N6/adenine1519-N6)-dimethyltransferase
MVVLVQKEVAERVCARDGKESLLSLSVKAYGEPKIVYRVSRGSFHPVPNVDSAVLRVSNISRIRFKNTYHEEMFFKTIHAGFAHKRKFLTSNLKIVFPEAHLENLFEQHSISSKARAEDVTLPTWISLAQALC